jgi:hypothetical protein
MAVRAARLGGTLDIALGPDGGRVSLRMPLAPAEPDPPAHGAVGGGVEPMAGAA